MRQGSHNEEEKHAMRRKPAFDFDFNLLPDSGFSTVATPGTFDDVLGATEQPETSLDPFETVFPYSVASTGYLNMDNNMASSSNNSNIGALASLDAAQNDALNMQHQVAVSSANDTPNMQQNFAGSSANAAATMPQYITVSSASPSPPRTSGDHDTEEHQEVPSAGDNLLFINGAILNSSENNSFNYPGPTGPSPQRPTSSPVQQSARLPIVNPTLTIPGQPIFFNPLLINTQQPIFTTTMDMTPQDVVEAMLYVQDFNLMRSNVFSLPQSSPAITPNNMLWVHGFQSFNRSMDQSPMLGSNSNINNFGEVYQPNAIDIDLRMHKIIHGGLESVIPTMVNQNQPDHWDIHQNTSPYSLAPLPPQLGPLFSDLELNQPMATENVFDTQLYGSLPSEASSSILRQRQLYNQTFQNLNQEPSQPNLFSSSPLPPPSASIIGHHQNSSNSFYNASLLSPPSTMIRPPYNNFFRQNNQASRMQIPNAYSQPGLSLNFRSSQSFLGSRNMQLSDNNQNWSQLSTGNRSGSCLNSSIPSFSMFARSQQSSLEQQQHHRPGKAPAVGNVSTPRRVTLAPENYVITSAMKLLFGSDYNSGTPTSADSSARPKAKRPKLTHHTKKSGESSNSRSTQLQIRESSNPNTGSQGQNSSQPLQIQQQQTGNPHVTAPLYTTSSDISPINLELNVQGRSNQAQGGLSIGTPSWSTPTRISNFYDPPVPRPDDQQPMNYEFTPSAGNLAPNPNVSPSPARPVPNAAYDPDFARFNMPVDPHMRLLGALIYNKPDTGLDGHARSSQ